MNQCFESLYRLGSKIELLTLLAFIINVSDFQSIRISLELRCEQPLRFFIFVHVVALGVQAR